MTQSLPRFVQSSTSSTIGAGQFPPDAEFVPRHIGPQPTDISKMLAVLGVGSLDELIDRTVPAGIRLSKPLAIDAIATEQLALAKIKQIAAQNQNFPFLYWDGLL